MRRNHCSEIERRIARYVNSTRRKRGIAPLQTNFGLTRAARNHSRKMARARRIWHGDGVHRARRSLTYKTIWDFIKSIFYSGRSGENVGLMYKGRVRGFKRPIKTAKDIALAQHRSWMRSSGHKANILNSWFSLIGIGVVRNKNGYYCTQLFYG